MAQDRITVITDSDLKKRIAAKTERLGMTTSTAINIFLRAFDRVDGMPFDVTLGAAQPNEEYQAHIIKTLAERKERAKDPDTKWYTSEEMREMLLGE